MMSRTWAIVLGVICLVPLAGCGGRGGESVLKASTEAKPVPVTVAPLERRSVERSVEVVGSLRGWEDVTIGSKKVGRVRKVHHDMGDHVVPGALIVELETVDTDLAIKQAERQLQVELAKLGLKELPKGEFDVSEVPTVVQARVQLERARNNLNRERTLNKRGAGTVQDLQNAENDEQGGEASLANAILTAQSTLAHAQALRVAVDVARQTKADLEIRAPVPSALPKGVTTPLTYAISKRSVSEGQMLKEGEAVAQLVVENPLRLWANVPERFSGDVQLGQPVKVTVSSHSGTEFEGKVARINPTVDSVSRTFQVEVSVPNNSGMLRPGGFAKASIQTSRSARAAVVPLESVIRYAGVTKVFIVEGSKVRSIPVETGLEDKGWVEVIGDLPDSARVVTTGHTQLADGTSIVIHDPDKAGAAARSKTNPEG